MNADPIATLISIQGIQARGRHGANPGEQLEAQDFVVDVEIWVEVVSDDLERTMDYRAVVDHVRATVEQSSHVLLESLAEAVATDLFELEPVLRATAVVHKPGAAQSLQVADVSAEFTAETV